MLACENEHILHICASILLDLETVYCIFYFMLFGHICKPVVERSEDTYILIKKYRSSTKKSVHQLGEIVCMHACAIMSKSLQSHEQKPARLLWPWNFQGKHTGVGCYFLLKGIFLTQGSSISCISCIGRQIFVTIPSRQNYAEKIPARA